MNYFEEFYLLEAQPCLPAKVNRELLAVCSSLIFDPEYGTNIFLRNIS
jgi:hypothetical protein